MPSRIERGLSHGRRSNDVHVFQQVGRGAVTMLSGLHQDRAKTTLDNGSVKIKRP